jgi:twitching motility protein PilT
MSFALQQALQYLCDQEGSDLHVKAGSPPMVRIAGELTPLPMTDPLTPDDTAHAVREMLRDPVRMQEMEAEGEADFAYAVPGLARFRVNAFRQRGSISIVCRRIPYGVTTIGELGLPDAVREMAEEPRGIVLVTGTTGSGKSTTLAAMVDHVNSTAARHIVTIEDPIEFLHADKRSVINQREVGSDTGSFGRALRRVLRQDPDIILIGEMRDEETVKTALSAAETGHLVLSTLHTADAPETINRVIDFFPPHQHRQVRAMMSATLRGVISQRLIPSTDGGRVAALEILRTTGRVRDAIMNPDETTQLPSIIAEGVFYGMQTFDQALFAHVQAGRVTRENALAAASSPQDFKLLLAAEGRVSTSMADVMSATPAAPAAEDAPAALAAPAALVTPAPAGGFEMDPSSPFAPVNGR